MDKNREARRGVTMAASNGLSRRRHRSNSLRDSPVEDGVLDLRETARLRDRKKDRERDRDRDRERERERDRGRERDRERERDMLSRISKRRRSDKFMHGSMREDGVDDTSEESVNDDEDDDDDDGGGGNFSSMLILPPNPSTSSSPLLNHHSNNHHHYHHNSNNQNSNSNNNHSNHIRRSFPPPAKFFRGTLPSVTSTTTTTTTTITWKAANEMIGVSVPRKARSVSTKRSHDWAPSGGPGTGSVGEEKIHRQASTSPVRPSVPIVMATPAPAFPSSNSLSVKKKMKPNGPKLRPPKSSSNKTSSSVQDEIEIEIAEVLYGMMRQPQGPSKQELVGSDSVSVEICSNNNNIKSRNEAKSRVSSPISNSPSTLPLSSSNLPTNSSSSTAPMADIAPKSKRPRPVKCNGENPSMFKVRNSPILATTKNEMDQSAKTEPSQNLEKHSATAAAENGSISHYLVSSQASELQLESMKPDSNGLLADSKGLTEESESGRGDLSAPKEEPQSPKKESAAGLILDDDRRDNMDVTKANSMPSEVEIQREEKFQIDLMAPPLRSSLERDAEIDSVAVDLQPGQKPAVKEDEKEVKTVKDNGSVEAEEKKSKTVAEESESQKPVVGKERNIDLQRDLKKSDRDNGSVSLTGNKVHQHVQKKPQQPPVTEKTAQSDSLPLPISMASWPGGLPPMGYMAPLQGVVSMDGSAVSSSSIQPPHLLSSQPRPKRCATHCNVARNIHYHQQFMKMYPLWPAAAGSASLYGAKAACNLNVVSPTELHGTFPGKGVNTVTDKGQNLAIFPSHAGKDSKSTQPATIMDAAQRKQALLRQALPPGVPSNILHAPAFIFPLSQQQAPAAAVRPGSVKSLPAVSKDASSSASNSAIVNASASVGTAATTMSFNYPNMSGNETQYLAILQNNGYPFPISAHVGLAPAYRGTHAQAMPFFNGSFYSSQMLHPSQFQQQQQPLPTQSQQTQQGHQNTSISSGSSSSQKHLQNQQQRVNSSGINSSRVPLQGFPTSKNQAQVQRQQQNQQVPRQAGQHESEMGGEESPSTADDRVSHANMNVYGQNFAMPLRPPNFALMTPTPTSTSEKKPQQQQSSKAGVESLMPRTFAMTFASINGAATAPGFDISSIAQNPALLQSVPEAVTHGYQIMAAAQAAQLNKNSRVSEEVKTGGNDPSNAEEVRKSTSGKSPTTVGQSIAFSRRDFTDAQVSVMTGNTILDSSTQTLNLGSVPARCNVSFMPASVCNSNGSAAQQQLQRSQQQHEQMMQIQKQQQFAAVASAAQRSKNQATSCGSVHSDHLHASSVAAKFPNAFSVFPQNLVQSSSSQAQSPRWKNSGRTNTSQINSQSLSSSTTASLKNLPHQQGRNQQGQTQISFAANPKSSSAQGQTPPSNNQSASPPMIVGSPRSSSISKTSAIGSPRTTATTSRSIKCSQTSLSSQQAKNSPSMPSRKSSPVPSILGNPNISSSTGAKQQMSEQQQQQLSKHAFQQAQLFFSNAAYMQAQAQAQAQNAASATSSASAPSSFFIERHREQQQPGSLATSSSGMLSLCPTVTHSNSGTSDPEKAVTAACNIKGLSSHGLVQTGQFAATQSSGKQHHLVPPGFQNVHAVPTPVQVKPSEQKQPAGE